MRLQPVFDPSFDDPQPWTRHYQPGVVERIDYPTTSLCDMFERSCAEAGDAVATVFFGAQLTYAQLAAQVGQVAEQLRRLGVKPGDRVAIMLPNCPQHLVAFYAILRVGAIVVEHNPLYSPDELRELFEDHGARVAIVWDKAAAKLDGIALDHLVAVNLIEAMPLKNRLALKLPLRKLRATRDQLTADVPGAIPWRKLASGPALDDAHPHPDVHDLAVIQYTSGTTGRPKGAMLSHFNLYSNALQGAAWMKDAKQREETFYAALPFFHAFGMTLHMTHGVLRQARQVLFLRPDVEMILDAHRKFPMTSYCAVPILYERTAARAKERGQSLASAKFCISGAMTLPDHVAELWENVSGGLLVEGYGMTESSPVALGNPFHPSRRTGTIGVPFPSTWMRVVHPEDPSRDAEPGEAGELLLKGPQIFAGYWNKPEETAAALLDGGWLRTGDLVTLDGDGFSTIAGRIKELIITGGFNVSPAEVERVLATHPGIEEVCVVGERTEQGDETVVAVVVPAAGASLELRELRTWAKEHLAPYKVPRDLVIVDELPKNPLGKVLRPEVRSLLAERRGA